MAVNCCGFPSGMVGSCGVMAIETRTAAVTVRTVEPVIPPEVALMVDVPVATPAARPVPLTVAVAGVSEAQVALEVRSCVCPSRKRAGRGELLFGA